MESVIGDIFCVIFSIALGIGIAILMALHGTEWKYPKK